VYFNDGSFVRNILASGRYHSGCGCGFFYNKTCNSSLFVIFDSDTTEFGPLVAWSANPTNPVSVNATLKLTSDRGLVLQHANGTSAWSTNINSKSVAGVKLTDMCNLVLLDENNATIWQSYDHPTDTLVVGQKLMAGQNLISEGGLIKFSLSLTSQGLFAYVNSNPPQSYFSHTFRDDIKISYVQFMNQSLDFFQVYYPSDSKFGNISISSTYLPIRYMRFEPDGHLRVYNAFGDVAGDILTSFIDDYDYPTACGTYGVCTNDQCSCPEAKNGTSYFQQTNDRQPNRGCSLVTPLSCEAYKDHVFLELKNITYFKFIVYHLNINPDLYINLKSCKQACLEDCSCKAAIYYSSNGVGNCYLQSQIFSLMSLDEENSDVKVYIKVQNVPGATPPLQHVPCAIPPRQQTHHVKMTRPPEILLGSSLASFFALSLLIGIFVFRFRKKENADEAEEYYLDHVPGMPTRYCYDDLKAMTTNFDKALGVGGFGTVFEGTLIDGTKIAVKRLDGLRQIRKSFLAEVETIGSIHHINLVR
jgi:hypothetical protein